MSNTNNNSDILDTLAIVASIELTPGQIAALEGTQHGMLPHDSGTDIRRIHRMAEKGLCNSTGKLTEIGRVAAAARLCLRGIDPRTRGVAR